MWIGDTIDFLIPGFAHLFMGFPLSYYSLTQMKNCFNSTRIKNIV
jgi:hypothetical protein